MTSSSTRDERDELIDEVEKELRRGTKLEPERALHAALRLIVRARMRGEIGPARD
jgi:hypothetical protein